MLSAICCAVTSPPMMVVFASAFISTTRLLNLSAEDHVPQNKGVQFAAFAHFKTHFILPKGQRNHIALAGRKLCGRDWSRAVLPDQVRADGKDLHVDDAAITDRRRAARYHNTRIGITDYQRLFGPSSCCATARWIPNQHIAKARTPSTIMLILFDMVQILSVPELCPEEIAGFQDVLVFMNQTRPMPAPPASNN